MGEDGEEEKEKWGHYDWTFCPVRLNSQLTVACMLEMSYVGRWVVSVASSDATGRSVGAQWTSIGHAPVDIM